MTCSQSLCRGGKTTYFSEHFRYLCALPSFRHGADLSLPQRRKGGRIEFLSKECRRNRSWGARTQSDSVANTRERISEEVRQRKGACFRKRANCFDQFKATE